MIILKEETKLIGKQLTQGESKVIEQITEHRKTCGQLSKIIGISETRVRENIRQARKKGYLIDAEVRGSKRGYKVVKTPEELKRFIQIMKSRREEIDYIIYLAETQIGRIENPDQISINDYFKSLGGSGNEK